MFPALFCEQIIKIDRNRLSLGLKKSCVYKSLPKSLPKSALTC